MVWTYWEGPCPDYIRLCLDTIRYRCQATVLDRASFDALWHDDRDVPIDALYVAHRADFVRAYLLSHYGGMWIDADCIVLASMAPLAGLLARYDVVAYREPTGGTITNNLVLARSQTPLVNAFYGAVAEHVRRRRPISWLEIGSIPLTAAIEAHVDRAVVLPPDRIMPVSWSEQDKFLAAADPGTADGRDAFCYMLSNNSMPASVKSATREELLAAPTLLGELFRTALEVEMIAPNYLYWRGAGNVWATEYDRRKTRHPYYHITEMLVLDHVLHHAPCRVLEWGCGTGRHLRNLSEVPGVDAYGFDQSESMVAGMTWAAPEWRAAHVAVAGPTGPLPYPDAHFDVVVTSEALLHTRPEDLGGRLGEFARVCRGHILHIEAPPAWQGYSSSCLGCWGHDLVAAYRTLGLHCEVATAACTHQIPYLVEVRSGSLRWRPSPAMLALYRRMEQQIESGFQAAGVTAQA
jgi:hypothetical protein